MSDVACVTTRPTLSMSLLAALSPALLAASVVGPFVGLNAAARAVNAAWPTAALTCEMAELAPEMSDEAADCCGGGAAHNPGGSGGKPALPPCAPQPNASPRRGATAPPSAPANMRDN